MFARRRKEERGGCITSASSGDYVSGDYTLTTGGTGGAGGSVWVSPSGGTSTPYTITTTSGTSGATWVGGATVASTWAATEETVKCRFCDKAVEIGIVIQSKEGKKTHVCVKCAKEYMGGEKIKELFDLVESLATMAEVAKA